ncbi:uracil phosphoribosyltransferase [bacterium]|jgi:uracil phosphoribosyltransferase|nr:uracil phosphoribosyltransferase [bacterium]
MKTVHVIDHPLLKHKLGILRDRNTRSQEFRDIVHEMSKMLTYEAMRNWPHLESVGVETPIARAQVERISHPPVAVAILRAGNGMLDAVLDMIPIASAGFIGIYRDKFIHNTVEYYFKLPQDIQGRDILLCDPLIATADTMIAAIDRLKSFNAGKIRILSILCSERAVERLHHFHPDAEIYAVNIEKEVNESGYLVPGLGDAGDRLYQTK